METRTDGQPGRRLALLAVLAVVLLVRLPFLDQAVQGDDVYYLAPAEHAQIEPLHPNHVRYVFLGDLVDLRGFPHPPGNAWFLALLLALFGDVREVPFHAAYLLFSFIAALAMWALANRFSPRPLWATLLFLATPAFVVNGNSFEADLPFLACWMASVALFVSARYRWSALALTLAAMFAYQAVFLTPILCVYLWLKGRQSGAGFFANRRAWAITLIPPATLLLWQLFERQTTGALPAGVLSGYLHSYDFQSWTNKLRSAAALTMHALFLVCPALLPGAAVLAWKRRRSPDTLFLMAWAGLFFAGAVAVFFAGSARYLLPMAAPVALLTSRLRRSWLAAGLAAQMALSLGLALVNYRHWESYRQFAAAVHRRLGDRRIWINGEWGLRFYLEADGGLPLQHGQVMRPGDVVVTSELAYPVHFTQPVVPLFGTEIRPANHLRLIGLDSRSGYSTASRGFLPFGISSGPIDRMRAEIVAERHPTLTDLPMNAPEAAQQLVTGVYSLDGPTWRWMGGTAVVLLKTPAAATPLRATFTIPDLSPTRRLRLLLDGREVASLQCPAPGAYTISSPPQMPAGPTTTVTLIADKTFSVPGDRRELSVILTTIGFFQK